MINQDTMSGHFGKVEEGDRVRITLHDDTVIEGRVTEITPSRENSNVTTAYNGGIYVATFFVAYQRMRWCRIDARPTPEQKFQTAVSDQISTMVSNLTGTAVSENLSAVSARVIRMVREYDEAHPKEKEPTEVASVFTHPAPKWDRDPVRTATPAHQDREERPVDAG